MVCWLGGRREGLTNGSWLQRVGAGLGWISALGGRRGGRSGVRRETGGEPGEQEPKRGGGRE